MAYSWQPSFSCSTYLCPLLCQLCHRWRLSWVPHLQLLCRSCHQRCRHRRRLLLPCPCSCSSSIACACVLGPSARSPMLLGRLLLRHRLRQQLHLVNFFSIQDWHWMVSGRRRRCWREAGPRHYQAVFECLHGCLPHPCPPHHSRSH